MLRATRYFNTPVKFPGAAREGGAWNCAEETAAAQAGVETRAHSTSPCPSSPYVEWEEVARNLNKVVDESAFAEVVQGARRVFEKYHVAVEDGHVLNVLGEALMVATSHLCNIFDFHQGAAPRGWKNEAGDFNGALLKSVLSGMHHRYRVGKVKYCVGRSTTLSQEAGSIWKQLKYTMMWGRDDLIENVLTQVEADAFVDGEMDAKDERYTTMWQHVMYKAVVYALQRNNVHAVRALLERSGKIASRRGLLGVFHVGKDSCFVYERARAQREEEQRSREDCEHWESFLEAAWYWAELISFANRDQGTTHFRNLSTLAKELLAKEEGWGLARRVIGRAADDDRFPKGVHPKVIKAASVAIPVHLRFYLYRNEIRGYENAKKHLRLAQEKDCALSRSSSVPSDSRAGHLKLTSRSAQACASAPATPSGSCGTSYRQMADGDRDFAAEEEGNLDTSKVCELERKKLEHFLVKKMMQLEAFYLYLLGPDFKYRIGIQGTYTDLFLWNVLLNRRCVCVCACVRARMRGGSNRIV